MEKRILDAARFGHPRATATVLYRMQNRWYRYALARTGSPRRAVEVVQDSALSLMAGRADIPSPTGFDAWAMGFAVRSAAEPEGPENHVKEARAAGLPIPVGHLDDDDRTVLKHLHTIPVRSLVCLLLRIGERLPRTAVASVTGYPPPDVSSSVGSAIKLLRLIPEADWPVDPQAWYLTAVYPSDLREEFFQKRRPRWIARIAIGLFVTSVTLIVVGHYFKIPAYVPPAATSASTRASGADPPAIATR